MSTNERNLGFFRAVVQKPEKSSNKNPWGFILLPKGVSDLLPRRGRTTVNATVNTCVLELTLEPDGKLSHWFSLDSAALVAASIHLGDEVDVNIALLPTEPIPTPPADFAKALAKHPAAKTVWGTTSAIAQVDWIHWIESSKQAKTRVDRIAKACAMLESGKKRVCCFDPSGFYSKALSAPVAAKR